MAVPPLAHLFRRVPRSKRRASLRRQVGAHACRHPRDLSGEPQLWHGCPALLHLL